MVIDSVLTIGFDVSSLSKKKKVYGELYQFLVSQVRDEVREQIMNDLSVGYEVNQIDHTKAQMMSWTQLADLRNDPLCAIGAAGLNDRVLSKLDEENLFLEVDQARKIIKLETGILPEFFFRRYSEYVDKEKSITEALGQAGYVAALAPKIGLVYPRHSSELLDLPHIPLNGELQAWRQVKMALSGLTS